ncbi:S8 family serine peptidase [Mangrovimonas sp. TPBH4]|uniref:S8 family serine peptidase n=1 Tax=Mangrovimonas sp. TPBH4 TaxID=1645914 RepID=UPI0006B5C7DF|nr:S8 family serine peptidase [Mangrovimonas sp. TPBH4]
MKNITLSLLLCAGINVFGQTNDQVSKYLKEDDKSRLLELSKKFETNNQNSLREALEKFPAVTYINGRKAVLQGLNEDGSAMYVASVNADAAATVMADELYEGGSLGLDLSGADISFRVWEIEGVRTTHQELVGRVSQGDFAIFTTPSDETDHATHVTGTIIASGVSSDAKGMSYAGTAIAYDTNNFLSEMTTQAAAGMLLSNNSWGQVAFNNDNQLVIPVYTFGKYTTNAKAMDELAYSAPYYLPVWAAGNDRALSSLGSNKGGYDMLTQWGTAKNTLVVAAVNEVDNYTGPFSVSMSTFSNWGPTDDGRVKPDISAQGVGVKSSISTSDASYATYQGTSMASPSVTGTLGLLQEHYNNLNDIYMKAATVKALVAHTANEAGFTDGPDAQFGWGLLNAEAAAECITNDGATSMISETSIDDGDTFSTTVTVVGDEPLVVTISWVDPEGTVITGTSEEMLDNTTSMLVNDLDLRVTQGENTYYPWKLNAAFPSGAATNNGDNTVDNVEKIEVNNASGEYTITVTHKGTLVDDLQDFSLIVTGIDASLGVEENIMENISVWPNPAQDVINLKLTSLENNTNVSLYDIHGRMVYQSEVKTSSLVHTINVKEFSAGVYFLNVENGTQNFNKKIVIE